MLDRQGGLNNCGPRSGGAGRSVRDRKRMWNGGNRLQQEIARRICGMIVDDRLVPGGSLNVSQISKALNVSRTPVTAALNLMADHGLADRKGARGFCVAAWDRRRQAFVKSLLSAEDVNLYVRIAEDRVSGDLPDEVSEAFLLRRYGVERAALLGTLKELESDGLCQSKPGRGWTFEPSLNSPRAYQESYNFRKLLFSRCFFEPTYRFDKASADECRRRHDELRATAKVTPRAIAQCNAEFYETLAAMSGNRFILHAARSQNRIRRFLEYAYNWQDDPARLDVVHQSHMRILDLIEAGEVEAASRAVWLYLDEAAKVKPPAPADRG